MTELTITDEDGKAIGKVSLKAHLVDDEQYRVLLDFGKQKSLLAQERAELRRREAQLDLQKAEINAEATRRIRLANERADKATARAAEIVNDKVQFMVKEAQALERKSRHMRITTDALAPLMQAVQGYTQHLKCKEKA